MTQPSQKSKEVARALTALNFIIPIIERYGFRWLITGGFACYVYGVDRPLTDIDIDVDVSVHDTKFQLFVAEVKPYTTQPLEHFVNDDYDNYNLEITISDVVVDLCPMAEMNIINKQSGKPEWFYKDGFPAHETVDFHGVKLSLLSKELIIKNKEQLMRDEFDQRDIDGLKRILRKR